MRSRRLLPIAVAAAAALAGAPAVGTEDEPERTNELGDRVETARGWQILRPAPSRRTEVTAAPLGRRIAVIGGFTADGATTSRVDVFNTRSGRWGRLRNLPHGVNHAMAAGAGGVVYVAGGNDGRRPSRRAFAWERGRWRELPRMPEGRSAGGAALVGGRLYVMGGVGPAGLATVGFAFDLKRRRWSRVPGLRNPREHLGVAALAGRIYAVGGRTAGLDSNVGQAEVFTPKTGRWRSIRPLPTARGGMAATAVSGQVVAVGGENTRGTLDEVEAYDPRGGRWRALRPSPRPRHGVGVVGLRGRVYQLLGGPRPGLTVSNTALAITVQRPPIRR